MSQRYLVQEDEFATWHLIDTHNNNMTTATSSHPSPLQEVADRLNARCGQIYEPEIE